MSSDPLVKICGLTDEASLDAALEAGADFVGFVFFAPSPRHLDLKRAASLASRVGGRAQKVALTVDADDATLSAVVESIAPDWLQLHGSEDPARALDARRRFGRPIIKALGVSAIGDLARASDYAFADMLLFDARPPRESTRPGGNGASFDWRLLGGFRHAKPWLLSGGLTCSNLSLALELAAAPGVDVSSGVERRSGVKDPDLIARFVATARQARASGVNARAVSSAGGKSPAP